MQQQPNNKINQPTLPGHAVVAITSKTIEAATQLNKLHSPRIVKGMQNYFGVGAACVFTTPYLRYIHIHVYIYMCTYSNPFEMKHTHAQVLHMWHILFTHAQVSQLIRNSKMTQFNSDENIWSPEHHIYACWCIPKTTRENFATTWCKLYASKCLDNHYQHVYRHLCSHNVELLFVILVLFSHAQIVWIMYTFDNLLTLCMHVWKNTCVCMCVWEHVLWLLFVCVVFLAYW